MFSQLPIIAQAAPPADFLERLQPGDIFPIIIVTLSLLTGTLIALVAIIAATFRKVRQRQIAATLIRDLLDRNLSPQEIQQIFGMWAQASGGDVRIPEGFPAIEAPYRPSKPPKPAKSLL